MVVVIASGVVTWRPVETGAHGDFQIRAGERGDPCLIYSGGDGAHRRWREWRWRSVMEEHRSVVEFAPPPES
jgi:hypothetical protein